VEQRNGATQAINRLPLDLMVPLVARECGKIGQITWPKNGSFVAVRFPSAYEI
jgi:hypothetical protein